jgi:hypothetical protein
LNDTFHHHSSEALASEWWQDKDISYFVGSGVGRGEVHGVSVGVRDIKYRGGSEEAWRELVTIYHQDEIAFFRKISFPEFCGKIGP